MMKKTDIVIILVCVLTIAFVAVYVPANTKKTAFVDLTTVYNEFTLKKELETKLSNVQNQRKAILDTMKLEMDVLSKQLDLSGGKDPSKITALNRLRDEYVYKKQMFAEDNETLAGQYTDQIWKQLNQYIKDYGKAYAYTYIYGTGGSGSLMYADDSEDITEQVRTYVNERYSGK